MAYRAPAPNDNFYPNLLSLNAQGVPLIQPTLVTTSGAATVLAAGMEADGRMPIALTDDAYVDDIGVYSIKRFYSSGGLDPSYGEGGIAKLNLAVGNSGDAAVLADGSVMIASTRTRGGRTDFVFMKVQGGVGRPTTATLNEKGTLRISGSVGGDFLDVFARASDGRIIVRQGDEVWTFAPSRVKRIQILGNAGDERITIGEGIGRVFIDGGDGRDTLNGSEFDDILVGGAGDDLVLGNAGNDQLFGDDGNDKITGGEGDDYLLGGAGNDRLYGDAGRDVLSGAGGNDRLFGGIDEGDFIRGGAGDDLAETDEQDAYADVERMLA
jgi:Ca2+-binding RTX toxin-like protein